jgi:hypothetical protein
MLDFCLYVLIAVACGFAIYWSALHIHKPGSEVFGKWAGLAMNTLIVIGYTIRDHRVPRSLLSFWALISALLLVHLLFFILLLRAVEQWRLAWWILATPMEYILIGLIVMRVRLHEGGIRQRQSP